jgi:hypothetical protein
MLYLKYNMDNCYIDNCDIVTFLLLYCSVTFMPVAVYSTNIPCWMPEDGIFYITCSLQSIAIIRHITIYTFLYEYNNTIISQCWILLSKVKIIVAFNVKCTAPTTFNRKNHVCALFISEYYSIFLAWFYHTHLYLFPSIVFNTLY